MEEKRLQENFRITQRQRDLIASLMNFYGVDKTNLFKMLLEDGNKKMLIEKQVTSPAKEVVIHQRVQSVRQISDAAERTKTRPHRKLA